MTKPVFSVEDRRSNRQAHIWRLPDGSLHSVTEPALTLHFDGEREYECWVQHGMHSRDGDRPTIIMHKTYYSWQEAEPSDLLRTEIWATGRCGVDDHPGRAPRHRNGGPAVIAYFRDGSVKSETWLIDNVIHREDGPAAIEYSLDGEVISEEWIIDGGPAPGPTGATKREYFDDGKRMRETWTTPNGLHREDGPAYSSWFPNGSPQSVEYWIDGVLSRKDGPAAVEYFAEPAGQARCEQWRVDDRLHRDDGPAITMWHATRERAETQWWRNGGRRLTGGPAIERWNTDGDALESIMWSTEPGALDDTGYLHVEYQSGTELSDQWSSDDACHQLRLWHRWMLGLDPAPDEAPFTMPNWINRSADAELRSRLAYFPNGDALANRILAWREWPQDLDFDLESVARVFVQFVRDQAEGIPIREVLLDQALAGEVIFSETKPMPGEGEHYVQDLNDITDEFPIPHILSESIYAASGNHFLPIYWITEPLHGFDLTAWHDFDRAAISAVVGPNGIVIGPTR